MAHASFETSVESLVKQIKTLEKQIQTMESDNKKWTELEKKIQTMDSDNKKMAESLKQMKYKSACFKPIEIFEKSVCRCMWDECGVVWNPITLQKFKEGCNFIDYRVGWSCKSCGRHIVSQCKHVCNNYSCYNKVECGYSKCYPCFEKSQSKA